MAITGFLGALQAAAAPIVKKVLVSLGFGVVSYAALNAAMSAVQAEVTGAWGGVGGEIGGILGLAGFGDAVGIILGAFVAKLSYMQLSKIQLLAK